MWLNLIDILRSIRPYGLPVVEGKNKYPVIELTFGNVGPTAGSEAQHKILQLANL